jgi:hypothetical protein
MIRDFAARHFSLRMSPRSFAYLRHIRLVSGRVASRIEGERQQQKVIGKVIASSILDKRAHAIPI